MPETGGMGGGCKPQKIYFLTVLEAEVHHQSVGKIYCSRGQSLWAAGDHCSAVSSCGLSSMQAHHCCLFLSREGTGPIRSGPTRMASFYLSYIFKDSISTPSHIRTHQNSLILSQHSLRLHLYIQSHQDSPELPHSISAPL